MDDQWLQTSSGCCLKLTVKFAETLDKECKKLWQKYLDQFKEMDNTTTPNQEANQDKLEELCYSTQIEFAKGVLRFPKTLTWPAAKASFQEMYLKTLSNLHTIPFAAQSVMDFDMDAGMAKWSDLVTQSLVDRLYDTYSRITPLSIRNYYQDETFNRDIISQITI